MSVNYQYQSERELRRYLGVTVNISPLATATYGFATQPITLSRHPKAWSGPSPVDFPSLAINFVGFYQRYSLATLATTSLRAGPRHATRWRSLIQDANHSGARGGVTVNLATRNCD